MYLQILLKADISLTICNATIIWSTSLFLFSLGKKFPTILKLIFILPTLLTYLLLKTKYTKLTFINTNLQTIDIFFLGVCFFQFWPNWISFTYLTYLSHTYSYYFPISSFSLSRRLTSLSHGLWGFILCMEDDMRYIN